MLSLVVGLSSSPPTPFTVTQRGALTRSWSVVFSCSAPRQLSLSTATGPRLWIAISLPALKRVIYLILSQLRVSHLPPSPKSFLNQSKFDSSAWIRRSMSIPTGSKFNMVLTSILMSSVLLSLYLDQFQTVDSPTTIYIPGNRILPQNERSWKRSKNYRKASHRRNMQMRKRFRLKNETSIGRVVKV